MDLRARSGAIPIVRFVRSLTDFVRDLVWADKVSVLMDIQHLALPLPFYLLPILESFRA